jgi:uncharacterized membrane protein
MATVKAAAEAAAEAEAETAKAVAKEAAEEANRERLERYEAHEQVPYHHRSVLPSLASLQSSPQSHTISLPHSMCTGQGGGGEGGGDGSQGKGGALA